jgi:DNA polymerase elongation subunit (family B)
VFEDHVKPEIQFLAEHYSSIPDEEMNAPSLKTAIIDIEVYAEGHFPDKNRADDPIVAISVCDTLNDTVYSFGLHEYTGDNNKVYYFHCKNELELLRKFFDYMHKSAFDIITG